MAVATLKTLLPDSSNWEAELKLGFDARGDKTVLVERKRRGPLSVQRPFYPEGNVCHVYLLHPPGGIVGGDKLNIEAEVKKSSKSLITTPGASKFYNSSGAFAHQNINLRVKGELEWLPQENILFRGAKVHQRTRIDLSKNARFFGTEIFCLGRPASQEVFDAGEAIIDFRLSREGKLLQVEKTRITPTLSRLGPACLRGYPVMGIAYATPITKQQYARVCGSMLESTPGDYFALSRIDDVLVARFLGSSTQRAQRRFMSLWRALRPELFSRSACVPRIWYT